MCFNPYLEVTSVPKPEVPAGLSNTPHVAVAMVTTGEVMELVNTQMECFR